MQWIPATQRNMFSSVVPLIQSTLSLDDTDGRGTTYLMIAYTATDGIFDTYEFTINDTHNTMKEMVKQDASRSVRFEGLTPGTLYTVQAVVVSHSAISEVTYFSQYTSKFVISQRYLHLLLYYNLFIINSLFNCVVQKLCSLINIIVTDILYIWCSFMAESINVCIYLDILGVSLHTLVV